MNAHPEFTVRAADWHTDRDKLHMIRRMVFVEEQHVPEALEWDDIDKRCYHVLAYAGEGAPIGTGRLLPDGHIGRMAVLKEWRGRGVGGAILKTLLAWAQKEGIETVKLHAQIHAAGFYAKYGFTTVSEEFVEAGILHRVMAIRLEPLPRRLPPRKE